jgi:hypothetical protein
VPDFSVDTLPLPPLSPDRVRRQVVWMPGENPDKLNEETPVVREKWHLCAPAGVINVSMCELSVGGILSGCVSTRVCLL